MPCELELSSPLKIKITFRLSLLVAFQSRCSRSSRRMQFLSRSSVGVEPHRNAFFPIEFFSTRPAFRGRIPSNRSPVSSVPETNRHKASSVFRLQGDLLKFRNTSQVFLVLFSKCSASRSRPRSAPGSTGHRRLLAKNEFFCGTASSNSPHLPCSFTCPPTRAPAIPRRGSATLTISVCDC